MYIASTCLEDKRPFLHEKTSKSIKRTQKRCVLQTTPKTKGSGDSRQPTKTCFGCLSLAFAVFLFVFEVLEKLCRVFWVRYHKTIEHRRMCCGKVQDVMKTWVAMVWDRESWDAIRLRKWMKIGSQMITVRFLDTVLLQCHVNSGTSIVASYAQKVSYKALFSLHRRISIQGKWWEVPSIAIQLPGMLQTATKGEGLPATGFKRFCQKWDLESSILHWFEEKPFPNLESGILDSRGKKCLGRSWILNPLGL